MPRGFQSAGNIDTKSRPDIVTIRSYGRVTSTAPTAVAAICVGAPHTVDGRRADWQQQRSLLDIEVSRP